MLLSDPLSGLKGCWDPCQYRIKTLTCCTSKIPLTHRSCCDECRKREDLLFERAVTLKWFLSVQEALGALTEGVQCTLIFVASRMTQVKRIIPVVTDFLLFGSSTPEDIQLLGL